VVAIGPDTQQYGRLSQRLNARLGLPDSYAVYSPFPFAGINQKDSIYAIADQEFVWCENFIKTGNGFLRTVWDRGAAIYTAPLGKTIVYHFFYNIGDVDYAAVFLSDGTAVQVATVSGAQTTISSVANTFYRGTDLPGCVQWGSRYLLIGNHNAVNDYWVWDGTILYGSGGLGPSVRLTSGGSGYSSVPTVSFFGGAGSGAAGYATISNGSVNNVVITNPGTGYLSGDIVQAIFSGGGAPNSAKLTAVLTPGSVASISLTNPGSLYTVAPGVNITGGGGSGATAHAILGPNIVASVAVGAGGTGYTSANVVFSGGGGGSGAAATATVGGGAVTAITMTNFGFGYTSAPTVTITGPGTGATATATLGGSPVASIVIDTAGTGFTSAPAVGFTGGGGGSGAAATALLATNGVASVTIVDGGGGFATAPTLSFQGGGGSGATATAQITSGVITGVTVTNSGSGYTSVPAVIVQSGVSANASGTASLMPFGVNGNALETYLSRVWVFHPLDTTTVPSSDSFVVSAPGSFTDFSLIDGGTVYQSSDSFLRKQYTAARQSNGYLYPIGDSSVEVISNVQTSGNPVITTFNYQNADPETGTTFKDTVQSIGQTILFTNSNGSYAIRGGSVAPISQKMENVFDKAVFPPSSGALTPSSAVCFMHKIKFYCVLMTITDPFTALPRNVITLWDQAGWYIGTQTTNLTFISSQIVNSDRRAWGTDGLSLFQLFTTPSATLEKFFVTKQYGADKHFIVKQSFNITLHGQALTGGDGDVSVVINSEQGNIPLSYMAELSKPLVFTGNSGDAMAVFFGATIATTAQDFVFYNASIGYVDYAGPLGSGNLNAPAAT
jgi:hypothetical protein